MRLYDKGIKYALTFTCNCIDLRDLLTPVTPTLLFGLSFLIRYLTKVFIAALKRNFFRLLSDSTIKTLKFPMDGYQ